MFAEIIESLTSGQNYKGSTVWVEEIVFAFGKITKRFVEEELHLTYSDFNVIMQL